MWQSQVETEHYSFPFVHVFWTSSHYNSAYKGDQRLKCSIFDLSSKHNNNFRLVMSKDNVQQES